MHPYSSPTNQRDSSSSNLATLIATAAACLIMLVVALVLLREPIATVMNKWHEDATIQRVNRAVATDFDIAARELKNLREAAHALSDQVKQAIGVSLEQISEAPMQTPSEITEAIRKDDAFNDAWEDIRRVYPLADDFAAWRASLAEVEVRVNSQSALDSDRDRLQSLSETLARRRKALAAVQDRVPRLAEILAHRRSEKRFSSEERSPTP